jgi:hypothetical protein
MMAARCPYCTIHEMDEQEWTGVQHYGTAVSSIIGTYLMGTLSPGDIDTVAPPKAPLNFL